MTPRTSIATTSTDVLVTVLERSEVSITLSVCGADLHTALICQQEEQGPIWGVCDLRPVLCPLEGPREKNACWTYKGQPVIFSPIFSQNYTLTVILLNRTMWP
jgi:hypothetical protein